MRFLPRTCPVDAAATAVKGVYWAITSNTSDDVAAKGELEGRAYADNSNLIVQREYLFTPTSPTIEQSFKRVSMVMPCMWKWEQITA